MRTGSRREIKRKISIKDREKHEKKDEEKAE